MYIYAVLNVRADIDIDNFDYVLPDERIARYPQSPRGQSKLLVYRQGELTHTLFHKLPGLIPSGHLLVFNNTRVIQARLVFHKGSGARIEVFCLEPSDPPDYEQAFSKQASCIWKCMVGNARKWKSGKLVLPVDSKRNAELYAEMVRGKQNDYLVRFTWEPAGMTFSEILEHAGATPIPPYLKRDPVASDKNNYQTVYSKIEGSVAAPTAGLHFTPEILTRIRNQGNELAETTLHIGAGTFRPVTGNSLENHEMHREHICFDTGLIRKLLNYQGRIIAVGTTSVRTLETLYWLGVKMAAGLDETEEILPLDQWEAYQLRGNLSPEQSLTALAGKMAAGGRDQQEASTRLLIKPGYRFRVVNKIITNFHLPKSTLLLLVAAFCGEDWKKIYQYALERDFRFLSYGDSSFLSP